MGHPRDTDDGQAAFLARLDERTKCLPKIHRQIGEMAKSQAATAVSMQKMDDRMKEEIKGRARDQERLQKVETAIEVQETRTNRFGAILGVLTVIGSALGITIKSST